VNGDERSSRAATLPAYHGDAANDRRNSDASRYAPWWKVWLPIPIVLLLLDVSFNSYFWRVPKLSSISDDYTYQLLYDVHRLETSKPEGVRVMAFGSSVAGCFDPYQVEDLLEADFDQTRFDVSRLVRPGAKPSDYRVLLGAELDRIDPDIVVALVNLVDFINPSFEQGLKPGIRDVLPPWRTLRERFAYTTTTEKLELFVAGLSNLYRYRKLIRSAVRDHVKVALRWLKSEDGEHDYGRYADGYTKSRFGLLIRDGQPAEIDYFIHPAWLEQRGRVRLELSFGGERLLEHTETSPGWHRLSLPLADDASGTLHVSLDSVWSPRAADLGPDARLLGVQLKEPLSDGSNGRRPPFRYPPISPRDIKPFLRMGPALGADYVRKWEEALAAPTDFGHRFRLYREAKRELSGRAFEPIAEYMELRRMLDEITEGGRRVLLVNTPESALLGELIGSPYYRDYLAYLRELAAANPLVTFRDMHDVLPMQDLNDWHHVTFVGQIKLGQLFAQSLRLEIERAGLVRAGSV
jgi:hypothetical protein